MNTDAASQTVTIHCPVQGVTEVPACHLEEMEPLLHHLRANELVPEPVQFARGTMMPDGRLDLCKQGVGAAGCRRLTQALAQNTTVSALLLGTDGIGDVGAQDVAQLLGHNSHLEIVYLGCNHIGAPGALALAQALINNTSVSGLWLKRNPLGAEGGCALAEMLRHNQTLRTLDLVNTNLKTEGLRAIVEVLCTDNRSMQRLYLGGNSIRPDEAPLLARLLRECPHLRALLLNVNEVGDEGAEIIAEALHENTTLTELGLASNGISVTGGSYLLQALAEHPALESLDLGYSPSTRVLGAVSNSLGDEGASAVGEYFRRNRTLRRLNLRGNGITATEQDYIRAGLEANTALVDLVLGGRLPEPLRVLLIRNRADQAGVLPQRSKDVALIRSVYR